MSDTTYRVDVVCRNCGWELQVDIDKGKTVVQFSAKCPCPNCGCHMLTKNDKPGREVTYWDLI